MLVLELNLNGFTPSEDKVLTGAETYAKRKSTSLCLLAIPAFDRISGLYNRHLNDNGNMLTLTILKSR